MSYSGKYIDTYGNTYYRDAQGPCRAKIGNAIFGWDNGLYDASKNCHSYNTSCKILTIIN